MAEIALANGGVALVDDDDLEWLSQWEWKRHTDGYAVRFVYTGAGHANRVHRIYRMHRVIMEAPSGVEIDHRDGNRLNNTRSNLRFCTSSQNKCNAAMRSDNKSGIKGVMWDADRGAWRAEIALNKRKITLGRYRNPEHAKIARRAAEKVMHGEFRRKAE